MGSSSTQIDHVSRPVFFWVLGGVFTVLGILYTVLNADISEVERRSEAEDIRLEERIEAQNDEISIMRSDIRQILEALARIESKLQ